jgi:hypothetical protein
MSKRDFILLIVKPLAIIFSILILLPAVVITIYVVTRKERTAEFPVDSNKYINFTVYWGFDMYQTISISVDKSTIAKAEEKVFKRSYNAGGPLYLDRSSDLYYLALSFGVYEINIKNNSIKNLCFVGKETLDRLNYVGYFGLKYYDDSHDDDVAFMPAGPRLPRGSQGEDIGRTINGRCG